MKQHGLYVSAAAAREPLRATASSSKPTPPSSPSASTLVPALAPAPNPTPAPIPAAPFNPPRPQPSMQLQQLSTPSMKRPRSEYDACGYKGFDAGSSAMPVDDEENLVPLGAVVKQETEEADENIMQQYLRQELFQVEGDFGGYGEVFEAKEKENVRF